MFVRGFEVRIGVVYIDDGRLESGRTLCGRGFGAIEEGGGFRQVTNLWPQMSTSLQGLPEARPGGVGSTERGDGSGLGGTTDLPIGCSLMPS